MDSNQQFTPGLCQCVVDGGTHSVAHIGGGLTTLAVLRMQDGAASVMHGPLSHGLIDCGSIGGGGTYAATTTLASLAGMHSLSDVVVTHFHRDHFNGLRLLPSLLKQNGPITLSFPGLPRTSQAQTFFAAMQVMAKLERSTATGLPQVVDAFEQAGTSVALKPLTQAKQTVSLFGHKCCVLWPPRNWDVPTQSAVQQAIDEFERCAAVDPDLNAELQKFRERSERFVTADTPATEVYERPAINEDSTDVPLANERQKRPRPSRKKLSRLLGNAANALSLVLYFPDLGLLVPGDATEHALDCSIQWLMELPDQKGATIDVLLAPHHGTTPLGNRLAKMPITTCVSQDGPQRHTKHLLSPKGHSAHCVGTWDDGAQLICFPSAK